MTKILGISGRKQAGKNTAANFLIGLELSSLGIVRTGWKINKTGQLVIGDIFGDTKFEGIFDLNRNNASMEAFRKDNTDPYIKVYSFADLLKQSICIDILGLTYAQCYGSDADKKTITKLRWQDMPGVLTEMPKGDFIKTIEISGHLGVYYDELVKMEHNGYNEQGEWVAHPMGIYHKPGFMTARDVMQFVGTEIFRKMYQNVWADALVRKIKKDDTQFAIVCDVRFPNEVNAIKSISGKVLRLTRNPFDDQHDSETMLDQNNYDWDNFDFIINNAESTIAEQNKALYETLRAIDWVPVIMGE